MKALSSPDHDKPATVALRAMVVKNGLSPQLESHVSCPSPTRQSQTRQHPSTSLGAFDSCQIRQQ